VDTASGGMAAAGNAPGTGSGDLLYPARLALPADITIGQELQDTWPWSSLSIHPFNESHYK
jgi:hypothetical protein